MQFSRRRVVHILYQSGNSINCCCTYYACTSNVKKFTVITVEYMVYKVTTAVASNYESQTRWKKSENCWRMDIFTEIKEGTLRPS
jgi:hypothetical protein